MAVVLALVAAVSYGLADFVGGTASKRASAWAVALVTQLSGAAAVFALSVLRPGAPATSDLWWSLGAGIANGVGTVFLYRGLAAGRMGVVAPVSGVGAALVPAAVGLALGEQPPPMTWLGIAAAFPGIWLVAREPAGRSSIVPSDLRRSSSGLADGVLAGLGFGLLFVFLAQIRPEAGWLPLATNQLVAAIVVVAVALPAGARWQPREPAAWLGVVSGLLGATATGAFMVAAQGGNLTVASILTALYPAVTVLLAALLLREHIHRRRGLGLVFCGLAIALVAAGCTPEREARAPRPTAEAEPSAAEPDATRATAPRTGPSTEPRAVRRQPLLLVTHPTRPRLRLTREQARQIVSGPARRFAGLRVVAGPPAVARRTVAADPDALAALPATWLDPSVVPAVVGGVDPLRRPARYPLRVPGPAPGRVTTLAVGGDVMLARGVAAAHPRRPTATLDAVARLLRAADLSVVNLESTLSRRGAPTQGDDSFAADAVVLDGLAAAGVDAVSLANNHVGDYGQRALLDTVAAVAASPLQAFGAGRDRRAAARPAVLVRHGLRFAFLGFNAIGETPAVGPRRPGALSLRMPPRTGPVSPADLDRMTALVRDVADRADVLVVVPHWGDQYTHVAVPAQRLVARRLAAAGADLVVGGHPHWVQGLERYGETVVAHSLGNLVFDMDFMEQTMEGVLFTATFFGDRLAGVTLTPYRMDAGFTPRPLGGAPARTVLADVWAHSRGPWRTG